jgi:hypothetical protein
MRLRFVDWNRGSVESPSGFPWITPEKDAPAHLIVRAYHAPSANYAVDVLNGKPRPENFVS